jgi:8-oxo-dGTP pyrophosphatase MutT (NUDIX family)
MAASLEMNYCPRCAHPLEDRFVFDRTRRVCPSCDFIFWREHKVAAAAVVERNGQHEDPREAVVREVLEETGYPVKVEKLLDVVFGQEHDRGASLVIVYLTRLILDEPTREMDENEVDAVGFFLPDQLPPIAFKATLRAIELWRTAIDPCV